MNKKVSEFWQCGMVIIVPLGLWAFYRIKKLRKGVIVYLITGLGIQLGIPLLVSTIVFGSTGQDVFTNIVYGLSALFSLIFGIAIAMWYMQKWSQEWNETASDIDTESRDKNLKSSYPERYSKDEEAGR